MATIDTAAKLLKELLDRDRVTISVEDNNVVITKLGQALKIPIGNTAIVRSSIGGFR